MTRGGDGGVREGVGGREGRGDGGTQSGEKEEQRGKEAEREGGRERRRQREGSFHSFFSLCALSFHRAWVCGCKRVRVRLPNWFSWLFCLIRSQTNKPSHAPILKPFLSSGWDMCVCVCVHQFRIYC